MSIVLRTERLILRPYTKADIPDFLSLATEKDIAVVPKQEGHDDTTLIIAQSWIDQTRRWLVEGTAFKLATVKIDDGKLIGTVGLSTVDTEQLVGHIGFWIGGRYRNRGYATEAGKALVHFAFDDLGLKFLTAQTEKGNEAAERVLTRVGFSPTVGLRRKLLRQPAHENVVHWDMSNPSHS